MSNEPNPYVVARGDTANEEKYQQMVTEATGKPKEVRKHEFDIMFARFQQRVRSNFKDLSKRVYDLEVENTELKLELHRIRNKVDDFETADNSVS